MLNIHWKDWCWSSNSNTLATWCEEPTHWKRPWCWKRLKEGEERDDWVVSPTRWTWVWASSGSWWWTGKPGCCSPWRCKKSDMTERLNWTDVYSTWNYTVGQTLKCRNMSVLLTSMLQAPSTKPEHRCPVNICVLLDLYLMLLDCGSYLFHTNGLS